MTIDTWATSQSDRCVHGYSPAQAALHTCATDEWSLFVAAVKAAALADGTVHQRDVRPKIRGRIEPKHIGQFWRRARSQGWLADTGQREESNDSAGRNADKLDRIYELRAA